MTTRTLKGSKLWLGPAVASTVDTESEFAALTFVQIGEPEDFGELGDESPVVEFNSVSSGRKSKSKGTRDAGNQTFIVGHDALDGGQAAMQAAEKTDFNYAIKIELNDNQSPAYTKTVMYYQALVMSARVRMGTADNVVREVYLLAVNSSPIIIPSELI